MEKSKKTLTALFLIMVFLTSMSGCRSSDIASNGGSVLLARKDSGISSVSDLSGKIIRL